MRTTEHKTGSSPPRKNTGKPPHALTLLDHHIVAIRDITLGFALFYVYVHVAFKDVVIFNVELTEVEGTQH